MLRWAQSSPGGTPLNFLVQKWILDIFGLSSLTARLTAVLFGAASLWIFGRLAKEYLQQRYLIAITVFALLPQIFRYGWEARPYSQGMFFALLGFWYWLRLEQAPNRRDAIGFGLSVTGGLYSQVFSVFVALAAALWSLKSRRSIAPVWGAFLAGCAIYLPWFLAQRMSREATETMNSFSFAWQQITPQGFLRELSGGGYFCSIPLVVAAAFGRDGRLAWIAGLCLVLPVIADATLGYFFAGRQLIFALPFLALLAVKGLERLPSKAAVGLTTTLVIASVVSDIKEATRVREDWETPARYLASSAVGCVYAWSPEQFQYFRIYEPKLKQCDPTKLPDEFLYTTTRYSRPASPPPGYRQLRVERIGIAEIAHYRRDDRLKEYGLSRFVFRQ